jgi:hypothetical protein
MMTSVEIEAAARAYASAEPFPEADRELAIMVAFVEGMQRGASAIYADLVAQDAIARAQK